MKKSLFIIAGLVAVISLQAQTAKEGSTKNNSSSSGQPMNFVKLNLTGIALKNYSIQYERVLNRKFSAAIAFRTMPMGKLPFHKQIADAVGDDDPETKNTIANAEIGNFAITPEFRFYLSKKGYGRGFYIAPFYRFAKFKSDKISFTYENNVGQKNTIDLAGDVTANTGGILLGIQGTLGKAVVLDIWLLGPHYGGGNGNFSGTTKIPMTASEQQDLRQELEDIDLPLTNKTINVTANGATVKLDGPWGGIRSGISLGFRF